MTDAKREEARALWDANQPTEAGEIVFKFVPKLRTPKWSIDILELVYLYCKIPDDLIDQLIGVPRDQDRWPDAKQLFRLLRQRSFKFKGTGLLSREDDLLHRLMSLAQVVAKVVYNASDPPNPFDSNAGWWVPMGLKEVLDALHDDDLTQRAWDLVCRTDPGSSTPG